MMTIVLIWMVYSLIAPIKFSLSRHGRYTRDLTEYRIVIPRKVHADGSLMSFELPSFFRETSRQQNIRKARTVESDSPWEQTPALHLALPLDGEDLILELWPSRRFVSPAALLQRYNANGEWSSGGVSAWRRCHWSGRVRGRRGSRVALSACASGLAGLVRLGRGGGTSGDWLLEPLAGTAADAVGRQAHIVFRTQHVLSRTRSRRHAARRSRSGENESNTTTFCQDHSRERWRDAWAKRIRWQLEQDPDFESRRSRQGPDTNLPFTGRKKRFIEVLLVADRRFIEFHGDDAENYLLTIMNVANDLWSDASTGRYFVLCITRLIMLEKDVKATDLYISPDAGRVLDSFAEWAHKINPKDPTHPYRHDVAVLLTRYDICSDNLTNCNLLGLANLAQACNPQESACINEDAGLITGITTAHEIGHVMGAEHDMGGDPTSPTGCSMQDETGAGWIMAAMLGMRTGVWSNCSRAFFEKFLDLGLGDCLLDEPPEHAIRMTEVLPGVVYDADQQCKLYLGLDKQCDWKRDEICKSLWCEKGDSCISEGKPAAAGTSCGERRWCWGEQCVSAGNRPRAVDGAWGPWGPWGHCSRSCGAGVESRTRFCDQPRPSHRGRNCLGEARQYRVCNASPCAANTPSFWETQCSAFDTSPWWSDDHLHAWRPVHIAGEECKLNCANELRTYDTLAQMAADGTPCRPGTRDLCVQGWCVLVGCDWVLQSTVVEDVCGVCGGNGSLCRMEEMVYNDIGQGYTKILVAPAGAHNLRVEELRPSSNLIAIADKDGQQFYLSGDNTQFPDGEYDFPGHVKGIYTNPEKDKELLSIKGPLREPLSVYYAFFGNPGNPGVRITWFSHVPPDQGTDQNLRFRWETIDWQPCDAHCGGGTQVSVPSCVEEAMGKVSDTFCDAHSRPKPRSRSCNEEPCRTHWVAGAWGPCDGCLFRSGLQRRQVECMRDNARPLGEPILLKDSDCADPRPLQVRLCNSNSQCRDRGPMVQVERQHVDPHHLRTPPLPTPSDRRESGTTTSPRNLILDSVPDDLLLVMEAPMMENENIHLTEEEEKEMGDAMRGRGLDTNKGRMLKGAGAVERLKVIKEEARGEHLSRRDPTQS